MYLRRIVVKVMLPISIIVILMITMIIYRVPSRVYAYSDWADTFDAYPNATYYYDDAHTWQNNLSGYVQDFYLRYVSSQNSSFIEDYQIVANNTYFVTMQNGLVTKSDETYWNLQYSETLSFDLYLKPNSSSLSKIIVVNQAFVVYKTIYGDSNRDDKVNIYDCIILGNNFGNTGSSWNLNCTKSDWQKDSVINIFDCIIVGNHFGEIL